MSFESIHNAIDVLGFVVAVVLLGAAAVDIN